jgi:hypothetical protein
MTSNACPGKAMALEALGRFRHAYSHLIRSMIPASPEEREIRHHLKNSSRVVFTLSTT